MSYTVTPESFERLQPGWQALLPCSATNTVFLTPLWQELWWAHFGGEQERQLLAIRSDGDRLAGIAPLLVNGEAITVSGSKEVCDYLDFVVGKRDQEGALGALFQHLDGVAWERIVLQSLPGGSPTLGFLRDRAPQFGWEIAVTQEDVCPRVKLSGDWETFLAGLSKKDRHELRRKFRRLGSAGDVRFEVADPKEDLDRSMDDFFRLMRQSRETKAEFMTEPMERFFRHAMARLIQEGIGRLDFLLVDNVCTAAVFSFDYDNKRLLYNSGYDHHYSPLSVGLLLKAHILRDAIEAGKTCFDFLRGDEPYKYDLGGVDHPIYECVVTRG